MKIEWIVEPLYWHYALKILARDEIDCVEVFGRFEPCPKPFKSWDHFKAVCADDANRAAAEMRRRILEHAMNDYDVREFRTRNIGEDIRRLERACFIGNGCIA